MFKPHDTSAVQYITALSPTAVTAAGSGTAYDLSKFTAVDLIVTAGSTGAATVNAYVLRSGTSNGTFQGTGASVSATVLGNTYVRTLTCNSSAVWHKVYYTQTGAGSPVCSIYLAAHGAREVPIDQATGTTSYSVVSNP